MKEERKIVILGIGNVLLSDEGLGVKVIKILEEFFSFSEEVELVDGGVGGFFLIPYIEKAKKLLVVDAIRGEGPPGTFYKFKKEDLPLNVVEKLSLHELSFKDILSLVSLKGKMPEEIVILGLEPKVLDLGESLSIEIKRNLKNLINEILIQLKDWGIEPVPKKDLHHLEELWSDRIP